jgi:hypothetical protein
MSHFAIALNARRDFLHFNHLFNFLIFCFFFIIWLFCLFWGKFLQFFSFYILFFSFFYLWTQFFKFFHLFSVFFDSFSLFKISYFLTWKVIIQNFGWKLKIIRTFINISPAVRKSLKDLGGKTRVSFS